MGWVHDLNILDKAIKTSENPRDKPKRAQVEHLQGCMTNPIETN
jgi:hypothetical protein